MENNSKEYKGKIEIKVKYF